MKNKKNKAYYLALNYEIIFRKLSSENGGGYFAYYKDFKGVMGDGESMEESMEDVKSAFSCYVEVALENNEEIKEPQHLERSKRINITIPENILHKIDKYVKSHNSNRSAFFKESALRAMSSAV
jgi:predicted RNase H-like HicB family nuclease